MRVSDGLRGLVAGAVLATAFVGLGFGAGSLLQSCGLLEGSQRALRDVRVPVDAVDGIADIAATWFREADRDGDGYVDGEEAATAAPTLVSDVRRWIQERGEVVPEGGEGT